MPNFPPIIAWGRVGAKPTYSAEWLTVGAHAVVTVDSSGTAWTKPDESSHVIIQSSQPVRYTIDESAATPTVGFRLAANTLATIPCPNRHIDICAIDATATIQRQWVI